MMIKKITKSSFLLFLSPFFLSAFNQGVDGRRNIDIDPRFAALELDEEVYQGVIYDEANTFKVTNMSFGGITKILGVKNDLDDSNNILRLSHIKSLKILNPHYQSPRHTTNSNMLFFVQVQVVHNTPNELTDVMLIPHEVILCAEDLSTGMEKAWRLRDITSFEVNHSAAGPDINRAERLQQSKDSLPVDRMKIREQKGFLGSLWDRSIDGLSNNVRALKNWLSKSL